MRTQLGAVDAEMALPMALLLFGRSQSHNHPPGCGVADNRQVKEITGVTDAHMWLHRNR
jgi:hypothetical protein